MAIHCSIRTARSTASAPRACNQSGSRSSKNTATGLTSHPSREYIRERSQVSRPGATGAGSPGADDESG